MNDHGRAAGSSVRAIDPLDFSALRAFAARPAGEGRLFLNHRAQSRPADLCLLFIHGAYHGAWCYTAYLRYFDRAGFAAAALDLRGHGGLDQDPDFHLLGVAHFSGDVIQAVSVLDRPVFAIGHSVGALILLHAAQGLELAGIGVLAPSPPGNLPGAVAVPLKPDNACLPPPSETLLRQKYLNERVERDLSRLHPVLSPESAALMNDRYGLRVAIDPAVIRAGGFCIEAERDDPTTHPPGQDRRVAAFLGLSHHVLPDTPHCMMMARNWRISAALIASRVRQT